MFAFVEHIHLILLYTCVPLLSVLGVITLCILLKQFDIYRRVLERMYQFDSQPRLAQVVVLSFVVGLIVYGSTKNNISETNTLLDQMSAPRRVVQHNAPSPVSAEDIERGYRVVSEVEESSTLPILAGSITNDLLR